MTEYSKFKQSIINNKSIPFKREQILNSANQEVLNEAETTGRYARAIARQQYDKEVSEICEIVRILNNMAPIRMPEYNFNINEINGETYYKPDGTPLLIREYDGDVIRDYYINSEEVLPEYTISRILEHDKVTGRLRTRIEPITKKGSRLKTNITIFDLKVNNKYIIIQLSEEGIVNNISEFTGKGKSFQTLFRNITTFKPARYLEGKETIDNGFEMIDCLFDAEGKIVRLKKYANKKEVCIDYANEHNNVVLKTKN